MDDALGAAWATLLVGAAWATLLAVLDDAEHDGDVVTAEQVEAAGRAVAALRARGRAALEEATPYLWEYVDDVSDAVGETLVDLPHGHAGLWAHVHRIRRPVLSAGYGDAREPSPIYVNVEAEVTWEPEHGLQLVFDHTGRVARVGPYTGHLTVAAKYGDDFLGEIYG